MKKLKRFTPLNMFKILCLLLLLPINALHAKPIKPLPIEIQSDSALWDQKAQQAVHKGNVIMTQGEKTLRADELIIEKNNAGDVEKLIAKGAPATFDGLAAGSHPTPVTGHADTILFFPSNERLLLKGDAELTQSQNIFKGPEVAFDFVSKQITAQSSASGRPTLIYQPQKM